MQHEHQTDDRTKHTGAVAEKEHSFESAHSNSSRVSEVPSISTTVKYIRYLYNIINDKLFEGALSNLTITVQADTSGKALGWFIPIKVWKERNDERKRTSELNISADILCCSLETIVEVLIHEMCHQFAYEHYIKDTSRQGYYHNDKFVKIAEQHGLVINERMPDGSLKCELNEAAKSMLLSVMPPQDLLFRSLDVDDIYQQAIWEVQSELVAEGLDPMIFSQDGVPVSSNIAERIKEHYEKLLHKIQKKDGKKQSSTRKYVCPICGQSVRATKEVNIICGFCHVKMVLSVDSKRHGAFGGQALDGRVSTQLTDIAVDDGKKDVDFGTDSVGCTDT